MTVAGFTLVIVFAFFVSTLASLAGYGSGLLMPLVLVPLIGAQAVVPVLSVSGLFNNVGRIAAFRAHVQWRVAWSIMLTSIPACLLGASFFTRLDSAQASFLIGAVLLLLVPGRRFIKLVNLSGKPAIILSAGVIYGFLVGMAPGTGIILITILMAMGVPPHAVIATDAVISLFVGVAKVGAFQALGAMTGDLWIIALVIGLVSLPGAFVARWLLNHIHAKVHEFILDAAVLLGGVMLILRGLYG